MKLVIFSPTDFSSAILNFDDVYGILCPALNDYEHVAKQM